MGNPEQDNLEMDLMLSDRAVQQVKSLLARDQREGQGLRIAVTNGGCSGFSYQLKFEKEPGAGCRLRARRSDGICG